MRRMLTNNNIVTVVNNAIEDGDIEVLPEIEEGDAGKVLKVNTDEDGVEWGEAEGGEGGGFSCIVNQAGGLWAIGNKKLSGVSNSYPSNLSSLIGSQPSGLILDSTSADRSATTYINGRSNPRFQTSLLMSATDQLPDMTSSIYLGETGFVNQTNDPTNLTASIILNTTNQYPAYTRSFKSSIILHTEANQYFEMGAKNSILLGISGRSQNGVDGVINLGMTVPYCSGYQNCILTAKDTTLTNSSGSGYKIGMLILGRGHTIELNGKKTGYSVIGQYADTTSNTDQFVVGSGASGALANCFTTGNDGTDDYIKIGDTTLTETQLTSLLALLD